MNAYLAIPVRYLAGRKLRALLTTLAVVFGVAVVLAVNMLLPPLQAALTAGAMGVTGQVDITVTSATGAPFPDDIASTVAHTDGVAAAAPAFVRQVILSGGPNAPQFDLIGIDPTRAETVRYYQVSAGRFLNADDTDSAVISQGLAQALNLHPGGRLKLPTPQGVTELVVVGVFGAQGGDQVLVPLQTAQRLFNAPGQLTEVDVVVAAGADRDAVKRALQDRLGPDYSVGTNTATSAYAQDIQLGEAIFNIMGILTLFMGAFLIFNTFRTLAVERRHDIGMLRAVGATRSMVTRMILLEAALQGLVGTAIGLVLGYLLGMALFGALQNQLQHFARIRLGNLVVPWQAVALSVVLGVGMTLLAGLLPAISAGRVPVLVALRGEPMQAERRRVGVGSIIGVAVAAVGVVLLFVGSAGLSALGGVLILTGMVMLAPLLLHPIARVLEPVTRWLFAREGLIAEGNLERNPGRASITMSALMIAVAVIVALYSTFSSIHGTYTRNLQKTLGADILILPPSLGLWNGVVGVTDQFEQQLAGIPGIENVTGLSYMPAQVNGVSVQLMGLDPITYPKVSGMLFLDGDDRVYAQLAQGRTAIATGLLATSLGIKVGDSVPVRTTSGVHSYRIVAIGTDFTGMKVAGLYISKQNMAADFGRHEDVMVMANLARNASAAEVRANVQKLLQGYPQFTLYWGADYRAQTAQQLDQLFTAFYVLLIALMIPSALGLINTLTINVLERTREIGVLRAIGATQGQIRRVVVAESLLLALAGTALGLLAGLALGYALVALIGAAVYPTVYDFPAGGVLAAIAAAIIIALLASLLPARQAARVRIVQALRYE